MAALVLLTTSTFFPAIGHEFVAFDDVDWIVKNPDYNPPSFAKFGRSWVEAYPDLYTPTLWTVWGLLAMVARSDVAGRVAWDAMPYHAFNVAAHVGAVVMAFLVLRRLVRSQRAAFVGAAVFAVHPVQVEAVVWVSGMKTPLSGFFALWAVWHYLWFSDARDDAAAADRTTSRRQAWLHYGAATFAFVLALITKPTVVVLPAIVVVFETLLRSRPVRRWILPLAPWFALAIVCSIINKGAQPAATVFRPAPWERVLVALDSLGFYLGKLIFPYPLLPDYSRTPESLVAAGWMRPGWIVAAVVLVAAALATARRRAPWFAAAVATFALGAVTTLGLIPYDYQVYTTVADRYVYLSLFGAAVAVAFLVRGRAAAAEVEPRGWRLTAGAGLVAVCAVATVVQSLRWRDTRTLFHYTLNHNPKSLAAYRALSLDAFDRNDPSEALRLATDGLKVRPGDSVLLQWVGTVHFMQGRYEEAADAFAEGVQGERNRSENYNGLGQSLAALRRPAEAQAALEESIHIWPENAVAHENLGILFGRMRQWDRAVAELDRALQLDPTLPRAAAAREAAIRHRDQERGSTTKPGVP